MSNLILRWLLSSLGLFLISELLPGITVTGIYPALIAVLLLGILNVLIRPILIILTLPITVITLGLFAFVINALLFWFVSSFVQGFDISEPVFLNALLGSLFMSLVNILGSRWIKGDQKTDRVVYKEIRD